MKFITQIGSNLKLLLGHINGIEPSTSQFLGEHSRTTFVEMHHVQVNFTAADSHKDKGWDINMILRLQSESEAAEVSCSKAEAQRAQLMRWRSLLLAADRCFPLLMFLRAQTFSMSAVQLPNEPGISTIPLLLSAK